jgi:hypothetical protein
MYKDAPNGEWVSSDKHALGVFVRAANKGLRVDAASNSERREVAGYARSRKRRDRARRDGVSGTREG